MQRPWRISMRRSVIAVVATGLAVLAAACSSSSSSTTTTSGSGSATTVRPGHPPPRLPDQPDPRAPPWSAFNRASSPRTCRATSRSRRRPSTPDRPRSPPCLAGSLDAGYMGPNSAITAYSQGHGAIRIISGATSGGAALVVSSSITSPSQLKGKTVATPQLGNTQDVALRTWLKKQGLTYPGPNGGSGEVNILPEDNSTTLASFEAGTIAGAWVPEPWVARMVSEGPRPHPGQREDPVAERPVLDDRAGGHDDLPLRPSLGRRPVCSKGQLATNDFLNSSPAAAQADANTELAQPDRQGAQGGGAGCRLVGHDLHQRPDRLVDPDRPRPRQGGRLLGHRTSAGIFDLGPDQPGAHRRGRRTLSA